MKYISLLIPSGFLFCSALLLAQNTTSWFVPGAKWAYSYESLGGPGEEYLDWVGHQTVGGELCAKLHYHGYESGWVSGPFDLGFRYFFARNDSVFLWNGSSFNLLYDFNRTAGDTFSLANSIYDQGLVLNIGDTVWNGIPLRFQDLRLSDSPSWPGGDTFYLDTRVYERLGGTQLIYWDNESPLTEIQYSLGCYRDNEYPQQDCQLGYDPTYVGFPQFGTSVWSQTYGGWCGYWGYQYKVEGDSVIWGVGTGKKVYFRNTYTNFFCSPADSVQIIHEPFKLIGLLDQSVQYKKVYFTRLSADPAPFPICVDADSFPLNQYTLLYDFDLKVGDTLHWRPEPNVVLKIDSIQMDNGTWRRIFVFHPLNAYYWIEGIGSNFGLLGGYANLQISDVSCQLQCFRYNNQVLYSTVNAIFCDSVAVATFEPEDFNNALRLSPNPTSGNITLEMPLDETPAMLRIFDPQGRELGRVDLTESQSQIDLSPWHGNAVLFLQIRGKSGQLAGRMLRME